MLSYLDSEMNLWICFEIVIFWNSIREKNGIVRILYLMVLMLIFLVIYILGRENVKYENIMIKVCYCFKV